MKDGIDNIDDLLGKFLAGEASHQEREVVGAWLRENEENMQYFRQLQTIFDRAALVPHTIEFDADAAWNKVKANLKKQTPVIPIQRKSYTLWYQAAAVVLILVVAGLYFFRQPFNQSIAQKEIVAEKTSVKDSLPGGTDIFLNKKTKVVYAYDAGTKTHEVKLKGEAYFNVKHSKREEFLVDAGGVFIRDIGTSFNVKAYPGQDEVEVLVEDGEIVFFTQKNPGIHLTAGGKGVYNKKLDTFTIEPPEPNITAYKTKFFVFEQLTLGAIVDELNKVYEKQIVIADGLKNCQLTVSFKDESIDEIADVIAETLGLKVKREGQRITLEGEGCD